LSFKRATVHPIHIPERPQTSAKFLCLWISGIGLLLTGCGGSSGSATPPGGMSPSAPTVAAGIHPLTQVNSATNVGYFSDPLPIHLAETSGSYVTSMAGTTQQILNCPSLAVGCYSPNTMTITTGAALKSQLPANTTVSGYQNNNVYQDNAGNWQMATTVTVNNAAANPSGLPWNVILHASPGSGSAVTAGGVPLSWTSDALLVGSFTTQANGNYDGKYIEDNGTLYLIYSKRLAVSPSSQDGIVAQEMNSATVVGTTAPTTLLAPESNSDGGYKSELFDCQSSNDQFKLIETGNISVVAGKYAMAYSAGSFETPCYKVGIAWSDALLGPYKKVLQSDPANVWQNPTAEPEVLYLLQSLQPAWPNYVNATVQGPGVPSLVQYPAGTWYLYFAGYDPAVPLNAGMFDPKLRQPYLMRLTVAIPTGATVAGTGNTALTNWITAATL
jgi:Glycosyl hydrolases family 43